MSDEERELTAMLRPGDVAGRYRLLEVVGRGGWGRFLRPYRPPWSETWLSR